MGKEMGPRERQLREMREAKISNQKLAVRTRDAKFIGNLAKKLETIPTKTKKAKKGKSK